MADKGIRTQIRYGLIVLALLGSSFLGACTPNGGGSGNNTQQQSQPAVETKSDSLKNFSGVQEPSESAEKERQERESGQEQQEHQGGSESNEGNGQ